MSSHKFHKFKMTFMSILFLAGIVASSDVMQDKKMDEWEALQISLRNAKSIKPKNGFVANESTAIKIAEAAAIEQFGESTIANERPFKARLYHDTWIVKGTLHPQGAFGGTAVVKVSKRDGRILFITHQY